MSHHTIKGKKNWKEFKSQKRKWKQSNLIQQIVAEEVSSRGKSQQTTKGGQTDADKVSSTGITKTTKSGKQYTVSLALSGSILDNAQSAELKTYLAGQIARAVAIFNVDEVVVFNDQHTQCESTTDGAFQGINQGHSCIQLARILQFLECPQYLRKNFFPIHRDLQYAGVLNPLDAPHHLRRDEYSPYREGVVTSSTHEGSSVNIGLYKDLKVRKELAEGLRVTIKLDRSKQPVIVSPKAPRTEAGLYWGYTVRVAKNLQSVFTQSPYSEGYDLTIGTSEKGTVIDEVKLKPFKHLLVVFGGLHGIEAAIETDDNIPICEPESLFDYYLNTCPGQGSRTIRTEEAILVSLSLLRVKMKDVLGQDR